MARGRRCCRAHSPPGVGHHVSFPTTGAGRGPVLPRSGVRFGFFHHPPAAGGAPADSISTRLAEFERSCPAWSTWSPSTGHAHHCDGHYGSALRGPISSSMTRQADPAPGTLRQTDAPVSRTRHNAGVLGDAHRSEHATCPLTETNGAHPALTAQGARPAHRRVCASRTGAVGRGGHRRRTPDRQRIDGGPSLARL